MVYWVIPKVSKHTKHITYAGVLNLKQIQCGWGYYWKTKMNTLVNPYLQNLAITVRFLWTWTKTSVKCYCIFLTTSLGINWCSASEALTQCLCLFKWLGRVHVSCGLCDRELQLSEERLALTSMLKIRYYFSFKAFWNSYYWLIKTLTSILASCKQSPCNFFKHLPWKTWGR